jgi:hypothetical protein
MVFVYLLVKRRCPSGWHGTWCWSLFDSRWRYSPPKSADNQLSGEGEVSYPAWSRPIGTASLMLER